MKIVPALFVAAIISVTVGKAEESAATGESQIIKPLSPEDAAKTIQIPDGYRMEVVASEPMVQEPVMFAFDGNGAIYVCEWLTYMQDEYGTDQYKPISRVVKLVDTDGDGRMDKRTVFLDNVILPRAVLPLHDRVLVTLTQSDTVWACFDTDNDGVADRREIAHKGRVNTGNIEVQSTGLLWNLDNTICSNYYRFRYDDGKLETSLHGDYQFWSDEWAPFISQWGLSRDDLGRLYCSDHTYPVYGYQAPAGYPSFIPGEIDEFGEDTIKVWSACEVEDQSQGGYRRKEKRVLQVTSATCGQTFIRSHLMPEFYGRVVTCEPVGRLIRMSRIEWNNGMGKSFNAYPGSEFIRSPDAYFRPVWTENGPDGGLYVADMYRGIVQERTWFPTTKGRPEWIGRYHRVKKWGMVDVIRHGRIYRLVPDDKTPGPQPRMLDQKSSELLRYFTHKNGWWRDQAQKLIVCRKDLSVVPALKRMIDSDADPLTRMQALWTLEGLAGVDKAIVLEKLSDADVRVRTAAIHIAERFLQAKDVKVEMKLMSMLNDKDPLQVTQLYLSFNEKNTRLHKEVRRLLVERHPDHKLVAAYVRKDQKDLHEKNRSSLVTKLGRNIYRSYCATCHGVDGKGLKEAGHLAAPALLDNRYFRDKDGHGKLTRILLKGLTGPLAGQTYRMGLMPPVEHTYDDKQIAAVLNYVGANWNGWEKEIDPSLVSRIRAEIRDRKQPYTDDEL